MSDAKIIEEVALSMADVKKELRAIKKRDTQLGYRAEKTEEYVNSVATLTDKDYKDIEKQINELNVLRLKEKEMVKILDLLPKNEEEVKLALSTSSITLKKEDAKKIADIIISIAK
ncbi:MAG: hypothetical protein WC755_04760 [Candidatus Woesearchaeota archaeon]|jgi:DNA-directed RNA polymerase subunit F